MRLVPTDASDEEVIDAIRGWVDVLATRDLEVAIAYLYHDDAWPWTPESLEQAVKDGSWWDYPPEAEVWVTPANIPSPAGGREPEVMWRDDGSAWIDFDLPLNGEWSHLTASFDLVPVGAGLGIVLRNLRVM